MKNDQLQKQEEAVAHILDDTADDSISIAKLYHLSDLPQELMDRLVTAWPTIPLGRRQKIARHLADIMEENYQVDFTPLFAHFLQDPHAEVRRAALDGLWDSSDTSLIPAVIALMQNDAEESVRVAAASALGHYVLMAQWGEIDPAADKPIVPALLAELDNDGVSLSMRRAALESVAASGHGRVPDLIQAAYASNRYELRLSAVYAMGYSADRRWLSTVLLELDHDEPDMRIEAARAAGMLSASDAIEKLAELI
ncbi:MAG: HEAT repeat domain-containing protein, partial [Anaerolineales bacterium]|nr:HEAT repeat domain-containing protein [Anaerolineales bacterium]